MQTIVPILRYEDARGAMRWLCTTFGFVEVFAVPEAGEFVRHAQLKLGTNVIMLGSVRPDERMTSPQAPGAATQALCVYVEDIDAHFSRAVAAGAETSGPPRDTDFGAREYHVRDIEGHPWTFGTYRPDADHENSLGAAAIARDIAAGLEGDPWHGPALWTLLANVTPEQAVAHPIAGGHSIIEIIAHISSWLEEVDSRARGNAPAEPAAGDWPERPGDPHALWAAALARLRAAQAGCAEALAQFSSSRLSERVGSQRNAPLGSGVSFGAMFSGLAQHNAYHAGQIALLKRALSVERSS